MLIGADGQLGTDLHQLWREQHDVVPLTHANIEICDAVRTRTLAERLCPDLIVNTAAFHQVDACEDEVRRAFEVNVGAVRELACTAQALNAKLVQFSTDYVFDGLKASPYVESDPAEPLSVYGMSRLAGEWMARRYCEKHYIIRTCGLYGLAGSRSKRGNFVETMLRAAASGKSLRVVADQVVTPTSTRHLAAKLEQLISAGAPCGVYHMTNTGECSWYEFTREMFRLAGVTPDLRPTTSAAFGAPARRPAYSVLDNQALRAARIDDFPPWQQALREYMTERASVVRADAERAA
jgi:dTDP-4-dehydrorhamnose reductase